VPKDKENVGVIWKQSLSEQSALCRWHWHHGTIKFGPAWHDRRRLWNQQKIISKIKMQKINAVAINNGNTPMN